ncbi:MAG: kinase/pyrophosphorylase [Lactobacillus sp.]|nr:kinase/pyrophosphorylase [Lactobacillus sp.]
MPDKVYFYVISDSLGDTNQAVINAAMAQFPEITNAEIKRFPLVRDQKTLADVLKQAEDDKGIIITSLVQKDLLAYTKAFAASHDLKHLDIIESLIDMIQSQTGLTSKEVPGALHKLNDSYYTKMNAINFASKYDDGKDPKGFLKADLVILGPSRTSKTPLSMYLANNHSLKVANLPLIPEVALPEEIYEMDPKKMVGLMTNTEYLQKVRTNRLHFLGLTATASYSDPKRIQIELNYAKKVMTDLSVPIFDITNQSIEESANKILESLSL